jgi:hypothetical protein
MLIFRVLKNNLWSSSQNFAIKSFMIGSFSISQNNYKPCWIRKTICKIWKKKEFQSCHGEEMKENRNLKKTSSLRT